MLCIPSYLGCLLNPALKPPNGESFTLQASWNFYFYYDCTSGNCIRKPTYKVLKGVACSHVQHPCSDEVEYYEDSWHKPRAGSEHTVKEIEHKRCLAKRRWNKATEVNSLWPHLPKILSKSRHVLKGFDDPALKNLITNSWEGPQCPNFVKCRECAMRGLQHMIFFF